MRLGYDDRRAVALAHRVMAKQACHAANGEVALRGRAAVFSAPRPRLAGVIEIEREAGLSFEEQQACAHAEILGGAAYGSQCELGEFF